MLDSDYRGPADEARVLVLNYTAAPVTIATGDRIAQAFVLKVPRVTFVPHAHEDGRGLPRRLRLDGREDEPGCTALGAKLARARGSGGILTPQHAL